MITLKNVSKWYGHFQVLTDCSTEVKKGEVVVVCGPSGSGKSTLIKTVNGLEPVQHVLDVSRSSFVTMNSAKIAPFSCIYETFGVKKAKRKQFRENRRKVTDRYLRQ